MSSITSSMDSGLILSEVTSIDQTSFSEIIETVSHRLYAPSNQELGAQSIFLSQEQLDVIHEIMPVQLPNSLYSLDTFLGTQNYNPAFFVAPSIAEIENGFRAAPGAYIQFPIQNAAYDRISVYSKSNLERVTNAKAIEVVAIKIAFAIWSGFEDDGNRFVTALSPEELGLFGKLAALKLDPQVAMEPLWTSLLSDFPQFSLVHNTIYEIYVNTLQKKTGQTTRLTKEEFLIKARSVDPGNTFDQLIFNIVLNDFTLDLPLTFEPTGSYNLNIFLDALTEETILEFERRVTDLIHNNPVDLDIIEPNNPLNHPIEDPKTAFTATPVDLDPDPNTIHLDFDEQTYLLLNLDVKAAITNGTYLSGLHHYLRVGRNEGRLAPHFDEDTYLEKNPDVAVAVNSGTFTSGFEHYSLFGLNENREGALIDEADYITQNPDVAAAVESGALTSATQHFHLYGYKEAYENGRYTPLTQNTADLSDFDFILNEDYHIEVAFLELYQSTYDDVAKDIQDGKVKSAFDHLLQTGFLDGRILLNFDELDEAQYLINNTDVLNAVESGIFSSGFEHFLLSGLYEGRGQNLMIDEEDYLSRHNDVAAAVDSGDFSSGLEHYLRFGLKEGRDALQV